MNTSMVQANSIDAGLLNVNTKNTSASKQDNGKAFGEIMTNQAKNSVRTDTMTATDTSQKSVSQDKSTDDKWEKSSAKETKTDDAQRSEQPQDTRAQEAQKEDARPEDARAQEAGAQAAEGENVITEEQMGTVKNVVEELVEDVKEELNLSDDELAQIMETLNIQPLDLLQPQVLTQLVTEVSGADSAIEMLTDADMYQQLCGLSDLADTAMQDIMEETGLSEEDLMAALEQMNATEGEDIPAMTQTDSAEDEVPVIITTETVDTQETAVAQQTGETAGQNAQTTEDTEQDTADEQAPQEETTPRDYQNTQDNSVNLLQKGTEQTASTAEVETVPTTTTDTTDIIRQIADYVKVSQSRELTEMEMQLHPASLGNVHIKLSDKNGEVTAQITTQNESVKNAIEAQIVQLRSNLEEQGVKVEAVEVSVASHEMERNLDGEAQDQRNQEDAQAESIKKLRRSNLNLNLFDSDDELAQAVEGLDDEARIAMEIMKANGNTVDLLV